MENSSKENIKFENTELYKFLKVVCNNGVTSKCGSNEILDAEKWLNSNKNKNKITSIVNYIVSLKFDGYKNLISTGAFCGFKNLSCDLKFKTYSILCLINSGVNPFDIQKCLESNHNTGFNWNNFSNSIENYKGDWYRVKGELISVAKAVMVVEFMNIFKSLLNSQEHTEAVDTSFEANAIDSYVCYFENEFEDAILRFIGFYLLDQKGFSAEYTKVLLGIPDGFVFKYFLAKETKLRLKNLDKNQLDSPWNLTYEGTFCCVPDGIVSEANLDNYKKTHIKEILKVLNEQLDKDGNKGNALETDVVFTEEEVETE